VVAQLTPWKGQDTAIRALALARRDGVDAHLLLIGSAKFVARATRFDNEAYVAGLRELIAREGLQAHVSWLGERDDVPQLIRALDVLLLPSQEEPFGRALIEAMALGVPVLATRVGGPPEIVGEGREGYLLDPHEPAAWAAAIRALAEDPQRREEMGLAGRERAVREFSAAHHAERVLEVYRRATA
jgi:glycosyltransferase involved in cell wall biosynthesis